MLVLLWIWYAMIVVEGLYANPKDGTKMEIQKERQQESTDHYLER